MNVKLKLSIFIQLIDKSTVHIGVVPCGHMTTNVQAPVFEYILSCSWLLIPNKLKQTKPLVTATSLPRRPITTMAPQNRQKL